MFAEAPDAFLWQQLSYMWMNGGVLPGGKFSNAAKLEPNKKNRLHCCSRPSFSGIRFS